MATVCPGTPPAPNEPTTTTADITVTPNVPQPIYSSNGGPNPSVSWNPTDEFCSLQFTATPGNELIVPSTQWNVNWTNQDATSSNDAGANAALAAGFGVAPSAGTPVTGPATSGPIVIGSNTLTVQILSGTIRVSMPNGSLLGYEPGDPVSNAVVKYTWANPIHNLQHVYFTNGVDQTPRGLTNYQTSAAVAASPTATCLPVNSTTDTTTNFNGSFTGADPGDPSLWEFHYGTTPGGPYPSNTGGVVVTSPSQTVNVFASGLTPGTTYYYVMVLNQSDDSTLLAQSSECSFTTIGPICSAASAVTAHSANLNGTLLGIPAGGYQYRMRYGTVSGGPYGTTLGPFPAPAGGPTPVSQPTGAVLTPSTPYFYIIEVLDPGNLVVSTSPECNFLTGNAEAASCSPATGITQTGATLNGTISGTIGSDTREFHYGTTPGGPYPTVVGAAPAVNGPVSSPTGALLPGTQYYYVVVIKDVTTAVVATSSQCTFLTTSTSRNPQCSGPTQLQTTQALIHGTVDNMPGTQYARMEVATVSGGPYTFYQSSVTAGNNTIGQTILGNPTGLTPGTTYYVRTAVYNDFAATMFAEASGECPFTAPNPQINCGAGFVSAINPTSAVIHGQATGTGLPATGFSYRLQLATVSGGPYVNAPGAAISSGSDPDNFTISDGTLTPSTTYFYRWQIFDFTSTLVDTSAECGSFTTLPPTPTVVGNPATAIAPTAATGNGTITNPPAGGSYEFHVGPTGGPYTTVFCPNTPVSGPSPEPVSCPFTGLSPNTQYCYVVVVKDSSSVVVATSPTQVCFMTLPPPIVVVTNPPTAPTSDCTTLHGTATNVPAGCHYQFSYGDVLGGPYDHTVPGIPSTSSGASPESWSATVCGLGPNHTIYYVAQVVCNPVQPPAVGPELPAPTLNGVYWCGGLHDPNTCAFIPNVDGGYFNCNDGI